MNNFFINSKHRAALDNGNRRKFKKPLNISPFTRNRRALKKKKTKGKKKIKQIEQVN